MKKDVNTLQEKIRKYRISTNFLRYSGLVAIFAGALILILVLLGVFRPLRQPEFRMQGFPTSLSKDVVATVESYEREELDSNQRKYQIKADIAKTFTDNHQELENVFIRVFGNSDDVYDTITASKAVYIPEENKNFTVYLAGSVEILTRDALLVNSEQVTYKKADETALLDEPVEFSRYNVRGSAKKAKVFTSEKRLELSGDVTISQFRDESFKGEALTTISANKVTYNQGDETIHLEESVDLQNWSPDRKNHIGISSNQARVILKVIENKRDFDSASAEGNLIINSNRDGVKSEIKAGSGSYSKSNDTFELKHNLEIKTYSDSNPTFATADEAVYKQSEGLVSLKGNASISQPGQMAKGQIIEAELYNNRSLKKAAVIGKAFAQQEDSDKRIEINAGGLEALYLENGKITLATAKESPSIQFTTLNSQEYKSGEITAARQIQLKFDNGNPSYAETDGRSTIELDADTKGEATSNKKLSADKLIAEFFSGGRYFRRTRAIGNAELVVEPLVKNDRTYRTVINSPEFDCTFFENVNAARQCVTGTPANALREPSTKKEGSGIQKLSAAKMSADFDEKSRDVVQLKAEGGAKFNELDKNGVAREIIYTASDGVIRLRGGDPTGWDSNARIRAREIDIDTRDQKSFAKGAVSTTYYSQKQTNSSTPFTSAGKPVFITADSATFDDKNQSAVYEGNARAWQENNYVRADKLMIDQPSGKFQAEGKVQSLLFEAPRIGAEKSDKSPVSALADSMLFLRDERKLIYTGNVNVRQAGDRIASGRAEIKFDEKGEVAESNFSENVTISQPGRRAFADFVTYTAAKNEVILRGQPARVEDSENGSTSAGELRINTVNNRVASEGKQVNNPSGRSRTVYKIKPN